ncbi:hypothetical protein AOLI_G00147230 [Acnodon oligacanthus]
MSHATCFILHMHHQSEMEHFTYLKFLWPAILLQQGYTLISIKIMMLNMKAFIRRVRAFYPEMSSLSNEQFECVLLQLKGSKPTSTQSKLLRPSSNLGTFMHIASYKFPKLTDELSPSSRVLD